MRLSDDDFAGLALLHDFSDYYETLSAAEMMDELHRLHDGGHWLVIMHQRLAMYRRFVDFACFDGALLEHQRSAVISVANDLMATLDTIVFPNIDADTLSRVRTALAGTADYIARFAHYPRAAEMIRVQARKPDGPYELGVVGKVLERRD